MVKSGTIVCGFVFTIVFRKSLKDISCDRYKEFFDIYSLYTTNNFRLLIYAFTKSPEDTEEIIIRLKKYTKLTYLIIIPIFVGVISWSLFVGFTSPDLTEYPD